MVNRSAITLKRGDVLEVPGLGTKVLGAVDQVRHDRYRIRLDEKFVESVFVEVVITNGEQRSPERPEDDLDEAAAGGAARV